MKLIKLILILIFLLTIASFAQAQILTGVVKMQSNYSGSRYYYISFGKYKKYKFYKQLRKYLKKKNELPFGLKKDKNKIGQHMTITTFNLKYPYVLNEIVGKKYSFKTEKDFKIWKISYESDSWWHTKTWYVKLLTPIKKAKKIFQNFQKETLHTTIAYLE